MSGQGGENIGIYLYKGYCGGLCYNLYFICCAGLAFAALLFATLKHENRKLKAENEKLKEQCERLETFAAIAKEEEDKAYIRGYYDSIGGYDI